MRNPGLDASVLERGALAQRIRKVQTPDGTVLGWLRGEVLERLAKKDIRIPQTESGGDLRSEDMLADLQEHQERNRAMWRSDPKGAERTWRNKLEELAAERENPNNDWTRTCQEAAAVGLHDLAREFGRMAPSIAERIKSLFAIASKQCDHAAWDECRRTYDEAIQHLYRVQVEDSKDRSSIARLHANALASAVFATACLGKPNDAATLIAQAEPAIWRNVRDPWITDASARLAFASLVLNPDQPIRPFFDRINIPRLKLIALIDTADHFKKHSDSPSQCRLLAQALAWIHDGAVPDAVDRIQQCETIAQAAAEAETSALSLPKAKPLASIARLRIKLRLGDADATALRALDVACSTRENIAPDELSEVLRIILAYDALPSAPIRDRVREILAASESLLQADLLDLWTRLGDVERALKAGGGKNSSSLISLLGRATAETIWRFVPLGSRNLLSAYRVAERFAEIFPEHRPVIQRHVRQAEP